MSNLSTDTALSGRQKSFSIRLDAIMSLEAGVFELEDLFDSATTPDGRALARLRLRRVLEALPEWTPSDATSVLDNMLCSLGIDPRDIDYANLTIRWLLDKRTGGNRWRAFWAAKTTHELGKEADDSTARPWRGFPFAPQPEESA